MDLFCNAWKISRNKYLCYSYIYKHFLVSVQSAIEATNSATSTVKCQGFCTPQNLFKGNKTYKYKQLHCMMKLYMSKHMNILTISLHITT